MKSDDFWPALMKFTPSLSVLFKPGECMWMGDLRKVPIRPIWGKKEQKEAIRVVRDAMDESQFGLPMIRMQR